MKQANSVHSSSLAPTSYRQRYSAVLPELRRVVTQQALMNTHASLAGIAHLGAHSPAPRTVFMGIGMTSATELSRALPLDVLGMLFSSEQVRAAVQARDIKLLLADAHALENGHPPNLIAQRCATYERVLQRIVTRLGWKHVQIVRATDLHVLDEYARLHTTVRRLAPRYEHPYVTREVADIAYFAKHCDGILKVGWAVTNRGRSLRDERAFDDCFRRWVGSHVGFVYCKAGRALDDRRIKAVPYVVSDPGRRVCLTADERVHDKMQRAAAEVSTSTMRAVRSHLKAIARGYKQLARPVRGSVEDQIQCVIWDLLGPEISA